MGEELEISHQDLGRFIRTRAGVVKEQEKPVIALTLRTLDKGTLHTHLYGYRADLHAGDRSHSEI